MPDISSALSLATNASPVGLAVQGGLGVAQTVIGLVNNAKAKKEARELARTRPKYEVNPLSQEGLDLAESELAGGMSSRAERAYKDLENRQFSSSLGAILRGGGSVNDVSSVFDSSQAGRLRLAQLNDQLRLQQIDNLTRAQNNMMEQEDKAFEFNEWRPWSDRAQANAQARQQATQGIWSGLQSIGAGAMNFANDQNQLNQYNNYLNSGMGSGNGGSSNLGMRPTMQTGLPRTNVSAPNMYQPLPRPNYVNQRPAINYPQYNQLYYGQ